MMMMMMMMMIIIIIMRFFSLHDLQAFSHFSFGFLLLFSAIGTYTPDGEKIIKDIVYGAVITARPLREFTRFI